MQATCTGFTVVVKYSAEASSSQGISLAIRLSGVNDPRAMVDIGNNGR